MPYLATEFLVFIVNITIFRCLLSKYTFLFYMHILYLIFGDD